MRPFPLNSSTRERLEPLGYEFLAEILTRATERDSSNVTALAELAHVLTRSGRLEEGLAVDYRLVRLVPENPTVHYNLACSLALLERLDAALDALERAVELGYDDPDHLVSDEDLVSLRPQARFAALVRRLGGEPLDLSSR